MEGVQHVYRDGTPNGSEGRLFLMEDKKRTVGVVGAGAAMIWETLLEGSACRFWAVGKLEECLSLLPVGSKKARIHVRTRRKNLQLCVAAKQQRQRMQRCRKGL